MFDSFLNVNVPGVILLFVFDHANEVTVYISIRYLVKFGILYSSDLFKTALTLQAPESLKVFSESNEYKIYFGIKSYLCPCHRLLLCQASFQLVQPSFTLNIQTYKLSQI